MYVQRTAYIYIQGIEREREKGRNSTPQSSTLALFFFFWLDVERSNVKRNKFLEKLLSLSSIVSTARPFFRSVTSLPLVYLDVCAFDSSSAHTKDRETDHPADRQ